MGWKSVKEHFDIKHNVIVEDGTIFIGSSYVSKLAGIDMQTGECFSLRESADFLPRYYPELLNADRDEILSLCRREDCFEVSIPVFTYEKGQILVFYCENVGWPNVTHDGRMMYENTFSLDKETAVRRAKRNAFLGAEMVEKEISFKEKELSDLKKKKIMELEALSLLEKTYPDIKFSKNK
jgi:hypothetical protein